MRTKLLLGETSQRSDPFCSTVRIVTSLATCVGLHPSRVEGRKLKPHPQAHLESLGDNW